MSGKNNFCQIIFIQYLQRSLITWLYPPGWISLPLSFISSATLGNISKFYTLNTQTGHPTAMTGNARYFLYSLLWSFTFFSVSLRAAYYPASHLTTSRKKPSHSHFIAWKSWWYSLFSTLQPTNTCPFSSFHFQHHQGLFRSFQGGKLCATCPSINVLHSPLQRINFFVLFSDNIIKKLENFYCQ